MQNLKEIPERKIYVDKLSKYGVDTSEFTESTIADSGKFWELYKKWEWVLKTNTPVTEKKEVYLKEVKKEESVYISVTELTVYFILFQSYLFPTKKRKSESSGGDARLMREETYCSYGPVRTLRETG